MTLETLALQGQTIISGSMASNIGSRIGDIRKTFIKECFSDYQNIEHRLEYVANIHGIEFINDSKATNVNSTWYALESMLRPVIWIAGGVDTFNDFSFLKNPVSKKVKAIIFLGTENDKMYQDFKQFEKPITCTRDMAEAVELAYYAGIQGDIVLLSPACASFDLFKDFEERGNLFKQAVKNL